MPEGTPPASAVRQAASPTASRGLRIGNMTIPWWAIGVGAVGVGLVGFLIYRNMQNQGPANAVGGSSAGTPTSPGVTSQATPTAATLVPLPYPVSGTTTGQTATQASGLADFINLAGPGKNQVPLYSAPGIDPKTAIQYYNPAPLQITGPPIVEPNNPYGGAQYPVNYLGQTYYANALNVSAQSLNNTQLAGQAA